MQKIQGHINMHDMTSNEAKAFEKRFGVPAAAILIFARFWQLETWLRHMIYIEVKSAVGNDWKRFLPSPKESDISRRDPKAKDKRLSHMQTRHESPLAYLTLGQLWDIIKRQELWDYFAIYFPPKDLLDAKLKELLQIRHRIAHCRDPHKDDLHRLEQFLRDIDQSFWKFCTSYNDLRGILESEENLLERRFRRCDQLYWSEVSPGEWAKIGVRDPKAVFDLTIKRSLRPWVRPSLLSKPVSEAPGVIYTATISVLPRYIINYENALLNTRELHRYCIHIILDAHCHSIELTFPSVISIHFIIKTIDEFLKFTLGSIRPGSIRTLPGNHVEGIVANWPEYVLSPSNPLTFLSPNTPCSFFDIQ